MSVGRFAWESTSIINVMNMLEPSDERWQKLTNELRHMHFTFASSGMDSVWMMKSLLGRQKFCWTTWQRYWVWEGADWRIFVNRKAGVAVEVQEGLDIERSLAAWNDFRRRVGLIKKDEP